MKRLVFIILCIFLTFGCATTHRMTVDEAMDLAAKSGADAKVSALDAIGAAPAEADVYYIVDGGVSKKVTVLHAIEVLEAALTAFEIHGDNVPTTFATLELPNANDTTTIADTQARIAHDNDDPALAIDDNVTTRYYAMRTKCLEPQIIVEPDEVQDISDTVPLYNALAEGYPGGFVIEAIHTWTSAACTDTIDFREYTNDASSWTNANQIESILLSGVHTEDDGTLAQNTIAADASLFVNLDGTCDVAWMMIQICVQIPVVN